MLIITHSRVQSGKTVKFIAQSKSRKSFLTCSLWQMWQVQCAYMCVCVCVCCVVVLPALAYFIFQVPAYAHDFNPAASGWRSRLELASACPSSSLCLPPSFIIVIFFFGWVCAKETTPLKHYIYLLPLPT